MMLESPKSFLEGSLVHSSNEVTMSPDAVAEAKAVIESHERYAMAGDLDAVMTNIDEDIVMLAGGVPLVEGAAAFRAFYAGLIESGELNFGHDYSGSEVLGDLVTLHGVSRGSIVPPDGEAMQFENSFIHILRRGDDGRLRVWRAAFAPSS